MNIQVSQAVESFYLEIAKTYSDQGMIIGSIRGNVERRKYLENKKQMAIKHIVIYSHSHSHLQKFYMRHRVKDDDEG